MPLPSVQQRALQVLDLLRRRYPTPATHLVARNPWELLVATVLAAQCTDERVNKVTPHLFALWPDPAALACATQEALEEVIHSTGFYRNKAKNLLGAARRVTEVHGGEVPRTMDELVQLPGVARKTANVVLWGGFGVNEGIAVDTHVKRIVHRMGLTKETDPVAVERDLMRLYPREAWGDVNHMLVWFGRHVCDARKPLCEQCEMAGICAKVGVGKEDAPAAPRKGRKPGAVAAKSGRSGTRGRKTASTKDAGEDAAQEAASAGQAHETGTKPVRGRRGKSGGGDA
jgi:endonuclease-3